MSEAQKYEGALYREKPKKGKDTQPKSVKIQDTAVVPRKAYVEDAPEDASQSNTVAIIDVPPAAPSPPPASELPEGINVFDYMVTDETPKAQQTNGAPHPHTNGRSQERQRYDGDTSEDSHYAAHGFTYGQGALDQSLDRYGSYSTLPPPYTTPAPKTASERESNRSDRKSDKKRKRNQVEDLDIARAQKSQDAARAETRPNLHSGLTGGLSRLLSRPVDELEREAPSPLSPLKRSKDDTHKSASSRRKDRDGREEERRPRDGRREEDDTERRRKSKHRRSRESSSSDDHRRPSRKQLKAIEYRSTSAEPLKSNQIVTYKSPAELFMSFVNKGPESDRGLSINKALKRYHRELEIRSDKDKESNDKDLWKELRVRKNERGEIVLFA